MQTSNGLAFESSPGELLKSLGLHEPAQDGSTAAKLEVLQKALINLATSVERSASTNAQLGSNLLSTKKQCHSLQVQVHAQQQELKELEQRFGGPPQLLDSQSDTHPSIALMEIQKELADFRQQMSNLHFKLDQHIKSVTDEFVPQTFVNVAGGSVWQPPQAENDQHNVAVAPETSVAAASSGSWVGQEREQASKSAATSEDFMLTELERPVRESIWSSVYFIGTPILGIGGSLLATLLLFLNIVIQGVFCGIIFFHFTQDDFEQPVVDAYAKWRSTFAHDSHYMDKDYGISLASSVCATGSDQAGLAISTAQSNAVDKIRNYYPQGNSFSDQFLSGPSMTFFSLICWTASLCSELEELSVVFRAMLYLPTTKETCYVNEQKTLVLKSISFGRRLGIFGMMAVRMCIIACLLYAGSQFVVYTLDIKELLLNCVALTFVVTVDELVFEAFSPRRLVTLIREMKPLRVPHSEVLPARWGCDFPSVILLNFMIIVVTVTYVLIQSPMMERIEAAEQNLCGQYKGFVYSVGAGGQVFWASSNEPSVDDGASIASNFYQQQALQEILRIHDSGQTHTQLSVHVESLSRVLSMEYDEMEYICSFEADKLSFVQQRILESDVEHFILTGGPEASAWLEAGGLSVDKLNPMDKCINFSWLCKGQGDLGRRVRNFCPSTCGCNDPTRFVVDRSSCHGCAEHVRLVAWGMTGMQFGDDSVETLKSRLFMVEGTDYFTRMSNAGFNLWDDNVKILFDLLTEQGCGAIGNFTYLQNETGPPCRWNTFSAFLHMYCPDSCGCGSRLSLNGEQTCPVSYTARWWADQVVGQIAFNTSLANDLTAAMTTQITDIVTGAVSASWGGSRWR